MTNLKIKSLQNSILMEAHHLPLIHTEKQATQEQVQPISPKPMKKLHSYTYWVDQNNKSRQLPPEQRPQKIDPPKTVLGQKSQNGRSDWNTVGTWEHRKVQIRDIEKLYTQRLNEWICQNQLEVNISNVSLEGQCEVILTRNKKVLTYQITGKVQLQKKLQKGDEVEDSEEMQQQKSQSNISNISSDSLEEEDSEQSFQQSDGTQSDKSPEQRSQSKIAQVSQSKSLNSTKFRAITFEITELTDQGDKQFKIKADNSEDKKFIAQKSNRLLTLLQDVMKSFK